MNYTTVKKLLGVLALSLLAFALSTPPAHAEGESTFALFGSYWNPSDTDDTFGGGVELSFPFGSSPLGLEARGTYYRELSDDAIGNLFENNEGFFADNNLRLAPVDVGLRYNFTPGETFNPWVSAGGSYFFINSKRKGVNLDNETGWYASLGSRFGHREGINFFGEILYRSTEATVTRNRQGDVNLIDRVKLNLDGAAANVGVLWSF